MSSKLYNQIKGYIYSHGLKLKDVYEALELSKNGFKSHFSDVSRIRIVDLLILQDEFQIDLHELLDLFKRSFR